MSFNFKQILGLALVGLLIGIAAQAASSATVTATVSVQNISVTMTSDGTVDYNTMNIGTASDTTTNDLDDSQTAQNNGNVTEDISIAGQDSANWTLEAASSTDEYTHQFCTTTCDASPTWVSLTTSNQYISMEVTTDTPDVLFDLQLYAPTSSTNYDPQSVDVTVSASAG